MKFIHRCAAIVLWLVGSCYIHAQKSDFDKINETVKSIPFIFQGEVVNAEVYAGDRAGNKLPSGVFTLPDGSNAIGYFSTTIQICKIYKGGGKLKHGTIEVISTNRSLLVFPHKDSSGKEVIGYGLLGTDHETEILFRAAPGTKVVMFCNDAKYKGDSKRTFENDFGVYPAGNTSIFYNESSSPIAYGFDRPFLTQASIDSFISKIKGLDYNALNACNDGQGYLSPQPDNIPQIDYQTRLNNYQAWIDFKQSITPKKNTDKSINATALILELANPSISGTSASDKYLEFDVMISATDNVTFFDNCLIRLQYSASVFGSNVAANNNIVITRGPLYNIPTYTNPNTDVIDQTSNTLGIPMGADFNQVSWNRAAATIFPEVLMHVKMKIQNCNMLSGINFTDITFTSIFSFYAQTANANIVDTYSYDQTNYNGQINDAACVPQIFSFTDYVPAGTGATLTITGNYFGQNVGSASTVVFRNANAGNIYPPQSGPKLGGVQYYDVVSWTDDEIQIRLPGVMDSIPALTTPAVSGSGRFKVVNSIESTTETAFSLTIPYAIRQEIHNVFPVYEKKKVHLIDGNGAGGYTFHCTPVVSTSLPGAKDIIRKALRDWSCVSGINWRLGNDTNLTMAPDGVCLIDIVPGTGITLQYTDYDLAYCPSDLSYFVRSFDIGIGMPVSWQVDSTGNLLAGNEDFYHAIAHELGHCHQIRHINDSLGDLMFYGAPSGPLASGLRRRVWLSPGAMGGGLWVAANAIMTLPCATAHVLNFPGDCTGVSVAENESGMTINTYPNPVSDGSVMIKFDLAIAAETKFLLYSEHGQLVRVTQSLKTQGKVTEALYVGDLASGVYFIQVMVNDTPYTVKLIKN